MNIPFFQLAGPAKNVELFGIRLLGVDAQNGRKLIFTLAFFTTAAPDLAKIVIAQMKEAAQLVGGR